MGSVAEVSELPVQFPTKYELVINIKNAKSIGLTITFRSCCAPTS
jgi:hypothetical protein